MLIFLQIWERRCQEGVHDNQRNCYDGGHHLADRAMQTFVRIGITKDMPLEYISRASRVVRIYKGPGVVHRRFIARNLLRNGMPAD